MAIGAIKDTLTNRSLVIFLLLGIVGLTLFITYFDQAFPEASLDLQLTRSEARERSRHMLESQGLDLTGYQSTVVFAKRQHEVNFLERQIGLEKANTLLDGLVDQTRTTETNGELNQLIGALVMQQQGMGEEALSLLEEWAKISVDSELAFWAIARLRNDREEEDRFYKKIKDRANLQIYLRAMALPL